MVIRGGKRKMLRIKIASIFALMKMMHVCNLRTLSGEFYTVPMEITTD